MSPDQKAPSYKEILLRIQKLNPAQKILLAQKGSIMERKILSRDSNIDVQLAVVNSPRTTEAEIEQIAAIAATPEVVLKTIVSSARWMKSLRVRMACLKNPKLPTSMARKFLSSCSKQQLRSIAKSPSMTKSTRDLANRLLMDKL